MKGCRRLAVVVAGGLALMAANAANAVPFSSGSFGFTAVTTSTADVTTATSFPLNPASIAPDIGTGDFALVTLPTALTLPSGAIDFALMGCCNWTDPQLGSFIGTVAPVRTQTTVDSAMWDVVGLYTVGTAFDNQGAPSSAKMTWTFTQPVGQGATFVTGTFRAPSTYEPPNGAPEPGTLALLGLGLAGLAASRRRKQ